MDIKAEIGRHTDEAEQNFLSARGKGIPENCDRSNELQFSCRRKKITADSYVRDLPAVWRKIESNRAVYGCNRDDTYIFTGA